MIVTRFVEIYALERAVDGQDFPGFVVGLGGEILGLPFRQADHSGGGGVDIKRG